MSYRFMRLLVMFDLPMDSLEEKREYRKFRRTLLKNGFIMLQESVYCRMVLNQSVSNSVRDILRSNRPKSGLVQIISVTEKQFSRSEFITGEYHTDLITSDERLIIL